VLRSDASFVAVFHDEPKSEYSIVYEVTGLSAETGDHKIVAELVVTLANETVVGAFGALLEIVEKVYVSEVTPSPTKFLAVTLKLYSDDGVNLETRTELAWIDPGSSAIHSPCTSCSTT
jgi:hypothetical protein